MQLFRLITHRSVLGSLTEAAKRKMLLLQAYLVFTTLWKRDELRRFEDLILGVSKSNSVVHKW